MDIIVKSILNYIQNQGGHSNSVLAGGAVRDTVLGLVPKDYDLFVPSDKPKDIINLVQSIEHEFSVNDLVCKTKSYDKVDNPQRITCVYGFEFEGKMIDVIGIKEEDDGDFPDIVIKDFDYGINMAYHDGNSIYEDNSNFREDSRYAQMTLINLYGIYDLPNAMARYNSLNDRYKAVHGQSLAFRAPCLQMREEKKKYSGSGFYSKKKYYIDDHADEALDDLPAFNPTPTGQTINTPTTLGWTTNATPTVFHTGNTATIQINDTPTTMHEIQFTDFNN